jgi:hypothetical protein
MRSSVAATPSPREKRTAVAHNHPLPNGIDKNIVRLSVTVGVFRARFKQWPTHARFEPIVLWDLAQILDSETFARLASLMELRAQQGEISVGGPPGRQRYDDVEWDSCLRAHKTRRVVGSAWNRDQS